MIHGMRIMRCERCEKGAGTLVKAKSLSVGCVIIAECSKLPTTCPWDGREAEWKVR